jgi:hypothetical protein
MKITSAFYAFLCVFSLATSVNIFAQDGGWRDKLGMGTDSGEDDGYEFSDLLSFDITHNRLLGDLNGTQAKWNSIGVNINMMRDIPFGEMSMFSIGYGFRFAFNNFKNDGILNVIDSIGATQLMILPDGVSRDKYKFANNFFEFPLELRFRYEGPDRMIRFSLGGVIGWRMRVFEHWTNGDFRYKEYNYPDLNKLRYGVFARVGFKHLGFYAGYYLNPVFSNVNSSKLNVLNFGLNIAF